MGFQGRGHDDRLLRSTLTGGGVARRRSTGRGERLDPLCRSSSKGSNGPIGGSELQAAVGSSVGPGLGGGFGVGLVRPLPPAMLRPPGSKATEIAPIESAHSSPACSRRPSRSGRPASKESAPGSLSRRPSPGSAELPPRGTPEASSGAASQLHGGFSSEDSRLVSQPSTTVRARGPSPKGMAVGPGVAASGGTGEGAGTRATVTASSAVRAGSAAAGEAEKERSLAAPAKSSTTAAAGSAAAANAAKVQAVANLQKLFFEEMKNGGDPNAAAAAALVRLTEASRPVSDVEPMRTTPRRVQPSQQRPPAAGGETELRAEAEDLSSTDRVVVIPI